LTGRFQKNGDNWQQCEKILPFDGGRGDKFGCSVAIYGNYAVIGAYTKSLFFAPNCGAAYIFKHQNGSWAKFDKLLPDECRQGRFGNAVSIFEDDIIIGSYWEDSGAAYVINDVTTIYYDLDDDGDVDIVDIMIVAAQWGWIE